MKDYGCKYDFSDQWRLPRRMEYEIIEDGPDCYPWRQVFTWWPVKTITGKRVWWCKLYKRRIWVVWGKGFHMEPHAEYATLFELLES
jgi:hypothetical protein